MAAVVALVGLRIADSGTGVTPGPTRTVEVASEACIRAVEAGKRVAKAAGTALYVAPDVSPLVRNALAAGDNQAKVANVLEHLRALTPSLRRAESLNESGDPPAWWRFQKWSAHCLGEPAVSAAYEPPVGNRGDVREMVGKFMHARIRGVGAWSFLDHRGRHDFGGDRGLAPLYPRPPLQDFEIVFVDDLGDGSYEVGVELIFARGRDGETLFVSFEDGRYAIPGGRPGLEGP